MSFLTLFLILLLALSAVVLLLTEPTRSEKLMRERLGSIARRDRQNVANTADIHILTATTFSSIGWLDLRLRKSRLAAQLQTLFEQAKVKWTVGRFLFASIVGAEAGIVLASYRWPGSMVGWIPGLMLGFTPYLYVRYKRSQHCKQFNRLLPDAIDLMSRALRAGHSVPAAIELVGAEAKDPLGPEFRRAAEEQSFGLPFREAILNLSRRMPVADLQFLVTAILVQKETGGNLAEVLDKTSAVLRDRQRLIGQIRIHTGQGKLTAMILVALPMFGFFLLSVIHPGYEKPLLNDPGGQHALLTVIGLMVVGGLWIRKIVNIKV
jgi:tight adherence protein B